MFSVEQLAYNVILRSCDIAFANEKIIGSALDSIESEIATWFDSPSSNSDRPSTWHFNKFQANGFYCLSTGADLKHCREPSWYHENKLFCDYYAWFLIVSRKVALGHESVPRPLAEVYQNCSLYNGSQPWYTRKSYFTCLSELALGAAIKVAFSDSPMDTYVPLVSLHQVLRNISLQDLYAVEQSGLQYVEE